MRNTRGEDQSMKVWADPFGVVTVRANGGHTSDGNCAQICVGDAYINGTGLWFTVTLVAASSSGPGGVGTNASAAASE